MTKGKPVKALLKFSVPLFAGNIMQNLYNVFDTAVVGHVLGKDALAAVGNSYVPMLIINSIILGLSSGILILLAQMYGSGGKGTGLYGFHPDAGLSDRGRSGLHIFSVCGMDFQGDGYPCGCCPPCGRVFEDHGIGNPIPVSIQLLLCGGEGRRGRKDAGTGYVRFLPYEYRA